MGALFGECVLNRESHYIRRWSLTNTSDTIVILSLTHQREFKSSRPDQNRLIIALKLILAQKKSLFNWQ